MAHFQIATVSHQMSAGHIQPTGDKAPPSGSEGGSVITGNFTLSLSADSPFRLWQTNSPGTNDTHVLLPGQTITNGIDGISWDTISNAIFYLEATNSGSAILRTFL